MKKILLSLVTIGVVGAIAAGATSAYFSDTETSTGNTFTAGALDLELGQSDTMPFSISDIVPGQSGKGTVRLTNTEGNIPGKLSVSLVNFVQYENSLTEPELNPPFGTHDYANGPNAGELNFFLQFASFVDVNKDGIWNAGDIQLTYNGQQKVYPGFWSGDFHYHPLSSMANGGWNNVMTMIGGQSVDLVVMWQFPGAEPGGNYSQNMAMSDSMTFDVFTKLAQVEDI